MSWYYKSYYSEKDIDFTSGYLNYDQFLLQEFFNCSDSTWIQIARYYTDKHGSRSFGYLRRKFYEWKEGNYHITDLMRSRILDVMPRFLTDEAKDKLGLHEFLSSIKNTVKSNQLKSSYNKETISSFEDFVKAIKNELDIINNVEIGYLRFNLISESEKREVLNISKYILKTKLQSVYNHITKDIELISPYFKKNNLDRFKINYKADFGKYSISLVDKELNKVSFPSFKLNDIASNNKYNHYAEKYLAYELKEILQKRNNQIVEGLLTDKDINIFLAKYLELKNSQDCEVKMNAEFKGEIGTLRMEVHYIPPALLDLEIKKKKFSLGYKGLFGILFLWWIGSNDYWDELIAFWIILIPASIWYYSMIKEDLDEINDLETKKKYYA